MFSVGKIREAELETYAEREARDERIQEKMDHSE